MIRVGIELEGEGRGTFVLTAEDRTVEIPVSGATDPVSDIAGALLALLEGRSEVRFSTFDPPAEHLWHLQQTGRGAVVLDVERAAACVDLEPGAPRTAIVRTTCPLRELAVAVSDALERIARSHGVAGYDQIWATHRFPSDRRRKLRAALRRSR